MNSDEINYKNLRKIQQLEKTSPLLSKINKNFYKDLSNYLSGIKAIIKKEENTDKIKLFREEINNTEKIALSIYENREKKIVQAALSRVRGGKPDLKNALEVEKKLFESIFKLIISTRDSTLKDKQCIDNNDKKPIEEKLDEKNCNQMVRVLENIPEFVGTDMKTYHLRKDDILTISNEMLAPMIKRGVVKEIK
jgi:DNA replication initiation complex subunit (GINS family)